MPPQLLYGLVARGTVVLAEYSLVSGNANLVAVRMLEKLNPAEESRHSYAQDRHLFHIYTTGGFTYMCMADEAVGRRVPFAFLEDVKERFISAYGHTAENAVAYEYNTEFSRVIQQRMDFFNNDPRADSINRVRGEIAEVKNVMIDNIEKILERGERIELLVDKTDHLQNEAFNFRRGARQLKNKMWWRNVRLWCFMGLGAILVLYIIICIACSPTFKC